MVTHLTNREDWLKARLDGIQASEAAAVIGVSPHTTAYQLWLYKTGQAKPPDISDNPRVAYGIAAEEHIRALFMLDYPQYELTYGQFDIYRNDELPFIGATLDGELFDTETLKRGVLEIKTAEISSRRAADEWRDRNIPEHYYCQIAHQLLATDFDFVVLCAQLKYDIDGEIWAKRIALRYEREDLLPTIEYLREEETALWQKIQAKEAPNIKYYI